MSYIFNADEWLDEFREFQRSDNMTNATTKNNPDDYKYIAAWGERMASFADYIKIQQQQAADENAPLNVVYKTSDGLWRSLDDLVVNSSTTRRTIESLVAAQKER